MNTFAGNFTLKEKGKELDSQDFDLVSLGEGNYFCMGQIDIASSEELLEYFVSLFGEIESYDISISTEDELEVFSEEYFSDGSYECVSFEGPMVDFETIAERFESVDEVVVVREAEASKKYKNRIIKVDFLY